MLVNGDIGVLLDLGGNFVYYEFYFGMLVFFLLYKFVVIVVLYVDLDIIVLLDCWMMVIEVFVYILWLWECFVLYFCKLGKMLGCVVGLFDVGVWL